MYSLSGGGRISAGKMRYLPSTIVVDRRYFESFSMRVLLLAKVVNTCRGFVVIKPELGFVLASDAIKTTVYLG